MAELASRLLQRHGPGLQRCGAVVSELDCMLGLAAMAAAGGAAGVGRPYCRPELTEGGELYIVNGGLVKQRQGHWVWSLVRPLPPLALIGWSKPG